jgi:DNA-binding NtrC family response regulator
MAAMQLEGSDASDKERPDESQSQEHAPVTTLVVAGVHVDTKGLKEFLKSQGHAVLAAASAKDALVKTGRYLPTFILLSGDMEGVNSPELLPELLMEHSRAAVILMAAKPHLWDVVEAIKVGAVDYLQWPLDLKRLKHTLDVQRGLFRGR